MSELKKDLMTAAIACGDKNIFFQGMLYSYGQFAAMLDNFEDIVELRKFFLMTSKAQDIPVELKK